MRMAIRRLTLATLHRYRALTTNTVAARCNPEGDVNGLNTSATSSRTAARMAAFGWHSAIRVARGSILDVTAPVC